MTLSTHVLDATTGRPAAGIAVRLASGAEVLAEAVTDADGRVSSLGAPPTGTCTLTFDTGGYFAAAGRQSFHPEVVVTFAVTEPGRHLHVPLLLSPFAYSTYRGS